MQNEKLELEEIRQKIHAIDEEILDLFAKRQALAKDVYAYKRERNLAIYVPSQEAKKLSKLEGKKAEKNLLSSLMRLSRNEQYTAALEEEDLHFDRLIDEVSIDLQELCTLALPEKVLSYIENTYCTSEVQYEEENREEKSFLILLSLENSSEQVKNIFSILLDASILPREFKVFESTNSACDSQSEKNVFLLLDFIWNCQGTDCLKLFYQMREESIFLKILHLH